MVQPKYSPQEALERVKLMMKYDTSKTLNENKETISEQYAVPAAAAGTAGALTGAGVAALNTTAGASVIVPVMSALGVGATVATSIVGGAAALAVLPLVYWLVTKDTGMGKVKKMFEMCSTEGARIAKLPRKIQDTELRSITDDIEDAIVNDSFGFQGGTDEEKLFGAFKKLEAGTASDFCALVKYYNSHSDSGDLFDDLDSDIDAESEWKQIFRPIRNCVEDSLLSIPNEAPVKGGEDGKKQTGEKNKKRVGSSYVACTGTYKKGCKSDVITKVQGCLNADTTLNLNPKLVPDGKFGSKTQDALTKKGFTTFTDADVDKICSKPEPVKPQTPGETNVEDVFNF